MKVLLHPPLIEELLSAESLRTIFPEEYYFLRQQQIVHNAHIEIVEQETTGARFFEAISEILSENPRLLLFLPFDILEDVPLSFRDTLRDAWLRLTFVEDVRENFNLGDTYEPDARKNGLEYVVKAAHLLPWLLRGRIVNLGLVRELLKTGNKTLVSSLSEGLSVARKMGILSESLYEELGINLEQRTREDPLYNSEKRKAWLKSLGEKTVPKNLDRYFLKNIDGFELPEPKSGEILIVGGSRLKGYSRKDSDLDFYFVDENLELRSDEKSFGSLTEPDPRITHLIFDTAWFGERELVRKVQHDALLGFFSLPRGSKPRRYTLERLEQDLLEYRLMHRFPSLFDYVSGSTESFTEIDGASAFYDERYRTLAMKMFVRYVFIFNL